MKRNFRLPANSKLTAIMKKSMLLSVLSMLCFFSSFGQNVGINNNSSQPHSSAMLDVKSPNKGFLLPRVALTGTNDIITIPSPALSLIVYNTATAGTGTATVIPGFYYWNGSKWAVQTGPQGPPGSANAWGLTGSAGTVDGTNYIGTSDNNPLNFRVNGQTAGRIENAGGNTFLGYLSGAANAGGQNNTALGSGADVALAGLTNATAIGGGAIVGASDNVNIGNAAVTDVYVGNGTTTQLHGTLVGAVNTPNTGSNNMVAVAYGSMFADATVISSSGNFSVQHSAPGLYRIQFTGSNLSSANLGFSIFLACINNTIYGGTPYFISFSGSINGIGYVSTVQGTSPADADFSFVMYKP